MGGTDGDLSIMEPLFSNGGWCNRLLGPRDGGKKGRLYAGSSSGLITNDPTGGF